MFRSIFLSAALAVSCFSTAAFSEDFNNRTSLIQMEKIKDMSSEIFGSTSAPFLGNRDGSIVLAYFSDYSCSSCKDMNVVLSDLVNKNDEVKVILYELPFLEVGSIESARFTLAINEIAGLDKYLIAHKKLLEKGRYHPPALYDAIATGMGLDFDEVFDEMHSDEITSILEENLRLAMELGIEGAPGLVFKKTIVKEFIDLATLESALSKYY